MSRKKTSKATPLPFEMPAPSDRHELVIEGLRQNNLRNISVPIPHNAITTIVGPSGSGKSSLAFDTLFAEGRWRFIESLSTYTRLFLELMDRPDVDTIRNIRPAIAVEQKNPVRASRSTVGTTTELNDYLRLLFARVGKLHCHECGKPVEATSPVAAAQAVINRYKSDEPHPGPAQRAAQWQKCGGCAPADRSQSASRRAHGGAQFFDWYNPQHQHSGLALLTPADMFHGRVEQRVAARQAALDVTYAGHPERFVHGAPKVARPRRTGCQKCRPICTLWKLMPGFSSPSLALD